MKVIIAGSRTFNDFELLCNKCNEIIGDTKDVEIVSGAAYGADQLGEEYAAEMLFDLKQFHPDWGKYKKSAGYIRNEEMAKYADMLIAFWNGESRGTKHMIDLAHKHNLKVHIITV